MLLALLSLLSPNAQAACNPAGNVYYVNKPFSDEVDNNPGDGICAATNAGGCTLRAAVDDANACSGADLIVLKSKLHVLSLKGSGEDLNQTGDLDVWTDITVQGWASSGNAVDATKSLDRIFHVFGNGTLSVDSVTLQNGSVSNVGGGLVRIDNNGNLQAVDSTFTGGSSSGGTWSGGAISADSGTVYIETSTLTSNSASGGSYLGGAIAAEQGVNLTVIDSTITKNTASSSSAGVDVAGGIITQALTTVVGGSTSSNAASATSGKATGGIHHRGGGQPLMLDGTAVDGNAALTTSGGASGGLYANDAATHLNQTRIWANEAYTDTGVAAGGFSVDDHIQIAESNVQANLAFTTASGFTVGGGYASSTATPVVFDRSSVVDNEGDDVGGLFSEGHLQLMNTTVHGNVGLNGVGGIYADAGNLDLDFSTVTGNEGSPGTAGQGVTVGSASADLFHSILAENGYDQMTGPSSDEDCSGSVGSSGYNILGIDDSSCGFTAGTTDLTGTYGAWVDPGLDVLTVSTFSWYRDPIAGGNAYDTGAATCVIGADQLNTARPQGSACDRGAVELP